MTLLEEGSFVYWVNKATKLGGLSNFIPGFGCELVTIRSRGDSENAGTKHKLWVWLNGFSGLEILSARKFRQA